MKQMMSAVKILILVAILTAGGFFMVSNWSWVFSKRVKGEIIAVERVTEPTAILSSRVSESQMHSYSVLIKGEDGKLYTASTEDRQWQVAKPGYCVEALLYRYPPWDLKRANTYFNARLDELRECPGKPISAVPQSPESTPESAAPAAGSQPQSNH